MSEAVKIAFSSLAVPSEGVWVVFAGANLETGGKSTAALGEMAERLAVAAKTEGFKGKAQSVLDILAPAGISSTRLLVVGAAPGKDGKPLDFPTLGGVVAGKLGASKQVSVLFKSPSEAWDAAAAADFALGMRLRAYKFDKYKSKKPDADETSSEPISATICVPDVDAAKSAFHAREAVAEGVEIARTLINEPPNVLYPESFAERAEQLRKLGVEVEVLDEKAMTKLGMGALVGVGQGSKRESRLVAMRWKGAKSKKAAPIAFVGKGVCFDSGGLSIKPAGGMEDMKGDMAGAACVVGLMHALARRKAKVNAIGVIGLVENMPDGGAIRPGDILTSMSGQTIEIVNTDAEGRLVLADALWWTKENAKPRLMIDLATLTGAIIVALGHENAGLYANDDELATRLTSAGLATGETVWRMPLGSVYDKMIDSKFADMKNTGGRNGGSITAAQFLKRFVGETPWAHLDIAGAGLATPANEINTSWAPGWGVRLLDRLVTEYYQD